MINIYIYMHAYIILMFYICENVIVKPDVCMLIKRLITRTNPEFGEMTQWLRMFAPLIKNMSPVPSTHIATACSSFQGTQHL